MAKEEKKKAIRLLLLQAWRERWSDIEWGIHLKKIIPLTVSGDSYSLSELILNQALVGLSPNTLLLSYLKNAISGQIVSLSATLSCIVKFEDIVKPHCTKALMDIVKSFLPMAAHYGGNEDPFTLAKSILHIMEWLLLCSHKVLLQLADNKQNPEYVYIVETMCEILQIILVNSATRALVLIAVMDEADTLRQIEQTESNVRGTLAQIPVTTISLNQRSTVDKSLKLLSHLSKVSSESQPILSSDWIHNPSINVVIHTEAILNSTGEIQPFVDQLLIIEKFQSLTRPTLICDILRACFLGLIDAATGQEELKWVAFTFLKLPLILVKLQCTTAVNDHANMEIALETLFSYTSLIDAMESSYTLQNNCDCSQLLIDICLKNQLLDEEQALRLKRTPIDVKKPSEPSPTQPTPTLILRAEPTVISIMKTLDADYSKNQDALLGVLAHMLSGKSFELILEAAAATGKLQSFTVKLVKFNEFAKSSLGESSKASITRALLFDVSFLMLCHITQLHGVEVLVEETDKDASCPESFISQWASRCLPLDGKFKSIDSQRPPEQNKLDSLISQFNVGGELKFGLVKWFEVCYNAPFAIREVLLAWEVGAIDKKTVEAIIENLKFKLCCLPVVACAWLCSYISVSSESDRQKALAMTRMILTNIVGDANLQSHSERFNLMCVIVKRMIQDLHPLETSVSSPLNGNVLSHELLVKTLRQVFIDGQVKISTVHTLDQLINVGGVDWFCDSVIQEMLNHTHPDDLTRANSLILGVFTLNIEQLTLTFFDRTLPRLLQGTDYKTLLLVDPKGKSLAQFSVILFMTAVKMRQYWNRKFPSVLRRGVASLRVSHSFIIEEPMSDVKPPKLRKLQEEVLTLHSEGFNFDLIDSKDESDPSPSYDTKDPLNKAMVKLFALLSSIINENIVTPRNSFILHFIREATKCGPQHTRYLFQFMPATMTAQLLKSFPNAFNTELVLGMSDLSSQRGRCIVANAICQMNRQNSWCEKDNKMET